jgi:hypothetical protein
MKDTYYVLAKLVWCGECDDFAIEEILRFKYNVAFASKEIYHYINLNYVRDDWDKSVKEYREGNRLYYYVDDINYDFDPHYDSLADAIALYTVYRYQQTEATDDYDRTLHVFQPEREAMWHIVWHKKYHPSGVNEHTYIVAPTANDAKEQWERRYGTEGTIIEIEGGPF